MHSNMSYRRNPNQQWGSRAERNGQEDHFGSFDRWGSGGGSRDQTDGWDSSDRDQQWRDGAGPSFPSASNSSYGNAYRPDQRYGLDEGDNRRRGRGRRGGRGKRRRGGDRYFSAGEQDEQPSGEGEEGESFRRERPPPGLKGREIGMWHARRSQAKKETQQKKNRPTVSMDRQKEENIRQLLDNLKGTDGPSQTATTSSSSSRSWKFKPDIDKYKKENGTGMAEASSSSSNTTFVYSSVADRGQPGPKDNSDGWIKRETSDFSKSSSSDIVMKEEEPPDSWEVIDDSDDDGDEKKEEEEEDKVDEDIKIKFEDNSKKSELEAEFIEIQTTTAPADEEVIDLDDYDDEGNQLPSVAGVVQYMKSHGDYPYVGEEPESDFIATINESDNPELDREMQEMMQKLHGDPQFDRMLEFRKKLPSYQMRKTIVDAVNSNQVLVISGETGCGKTTQVPQFILDDYIDRGVGSQCRVICTQPRRISAISVAERVAAERCEAVSDSQRTSVGYQIRLETKRPRNQGSILFCTTGIVLKFLENDPLLNRATHVIIDEIHERDLQSDFLMIILKDLLPRRRDLKVILMSATLNAEMFSQYFNKCPMLNIPGYTFPVTEYLLEDIIEITGYCPDNCSGNSGQRNFSRKGPRGRLSKEEQEIEQNYQVWCRNLRGSYHQKTIDVLQNFDYSRIDLDLIVLLVNHICTKMEEGAILIFVPGWEEIKKLHEMIQHSPRSKSGALRVIPLHSLMPTVNQREVFDRPPPGVRKIVIATNIAETSITIDDVVFVIDGGKIKVKGFQPERNLTSLEPQWVSKANAKQRRGRAGRVQPGHCFHMYTQFRFDLTRDYLPPEMLRTRLEELCLQIKLLKLGRIVPFIGKAMQHPSMEAVTHAVETLIELNALDSDENLLPLGFHLARMPVEPHTGKMILFGAMFCCLDPILTVAASLSFKDAFTIPLGKEDLADRARNLLAQGSKSDHIMLINAFKGWEESMRYNQSRTYCWENFLSENTLRMLKDMKKQLSELLHDIGFVAGKNPKDPQVNINSNNQGLIRAVLCAGLYPNVAQITKVPKPHSARHRGVGMITKDGSKVFAHPKSVNMRQTFFESKWMVFYHKLKTSKVYIHDSTMVSPYPLLFFGGEIQILKEDNTELISVDDWVKFKARASTAQLVMDLRKQLDKLLTKKITRPGPTSWDKGEVEGALMAAIADLITTEDEGYTKMGPDLKGSIGIKGM